ncbi:hypothetical protein Tco_1475596 [Tanacetum coccineum]
MTTLQFADTHNLVAFLTKSVESEGFEQIVDFLNASSIRYALTVNPTIYTSCIEQFWATVNVKTVNREQQLQALVDGKKIIITEATVRRDLQPEDADGVDCLPNATIFEQLTLMGKQKSMRPKEKNTQVPPSSVPSDPTNIADEAINKEPSMQLKELMDFYTKLQQRVLDLENTKTDQAQEITSFKKRAKKLEKKGGSRTHKLKRLYRVGRSARVVSSEEASLGDQEDASKQGRKIYDIDADEDITLENVHDAEMFDVNDLDGDEVVVESEVTDKAELKSTRPNTKWVIMQEPSESTPTISLQLPSQVKGQGSKDKDSVWKNQQGLVKVLNWKLYDSCGVHCVTMQNILYYLLVEKMYPLTKHTLHQMFNDVKLQVINECEMAFELLRMVKKHLGRLCTVNQEFGKHPLVIDELLMMKLDDFEDKYQL